MSIFENNSARHRQFDNLVDWSKKFLDSINKEDLSIEPQDEPGLSYIMAMCSTIGMSDPLLAMHIGSITSSWLMVHSSKSETIDKLMALHCFEGLSLMTTAFPTMTSVQITTLSKMLNGLTLVVSAMLHGLSAHSDVLTNESYDMAIENLEKAVGIVKLMKETKTKKCQ